VERPLQSLKSHARCVRRRLRSWRWPSLRGSRVPFSAVDQQIISACTRRTEARTIGSCALRHWWIVGLSTPSTGFTLRCSPRGHPCRSRFESTEADSNTGLLGLQLASSEARMQPAASAGRPPLLGFITKPPSTVQQCAVHSRPSSPRPIGVPAPTEHVSFHLRGFSPPWRLSPAHCPQVCCTLHPVLGFETFKASRHDKRRHTHPPGPAFTLQRFPLIGSHTASPRPLPP